MSIECDCLLSKHLKDYVWCYNNKGEMDDDVENGIITINIAPKETFHWDQHLSSIIKFPNILKECCKGIFQIDKKFNNVVECDIKNLMKNLNIEYSENLYNLIHNDNNMTCECNNCNRIQQKYFLQENFYNGRIKCSSGYNHIQMIISDIKYNFCNLFDIKILYNKI